MDTIMDEQLRVGDLKTQVALGKSSDDKMVDVMEPCVDDVPSGSLPGEEKNRNGPDKPDRRSKANGRDGSRKAYNNQRRPNSAAVICRVPDEHLFYSGFEIGTRTIAAIAPQVGGMVVRNESVRAAWAADEGKKRT